MRFPRSSHPIALARAMLDDKRRGAAPRGRPHIDGDRELLVLDGLREGVSCSVVAKAAGVAP